MNSVRKISRFQVVIQEAADVCSIQFTLACTGAYNCISGEGILCHNH